MMSMKPLMMKTTTKAAKAVEVYTDEDSMPMAQHGMYY